MDDFDFLFSSRQRIAVSSNYWTSFLIFKTLHIIEYGVLFVLWYFALYKNEKKIKVAIIVSFLYAIIDEVHQTFVPTREGTLRDVFIDLLGIIIFWQYLLFRIEKLIKNWPWLGKTILS